MIKKFITFIFYLFFLTCGDSQDSIVGSDDGGESDDGGSGDGGSLTFDCEGYPVPTDCPTDESVDGIPGCAYLENYCNPPICVGGTSDFSEIIAYCDCNGNYLPGVYPGTEGNCTEDISTVGCGQIDGCGVCYGGTSDIQEYTDCDCNGDVVSEDCTNPNTEGCAVNEDCGCVGGNTGIDSCPADCPDNFTISPQSTLQETICVPNDFYYYVSNIQAGYVITDVIFDGESILESDDWVGAFNNSVCVGAQQWDLSSCLNNVCSINAHGDSGQESTSGYMETGGIPTFKVYDVSENVYYDAIPSVDYSWYPGQVYPPPGEDIEIILTLIIP